MFFIVFSWISRFLQNHSAVRWDLGMVRYICCGENLVLVCMCLYIYLDLDCVSYLKKHGPINHGLATPFLSYRVTLNAFIRDLFIWQSYKFGPLCQCSDLQIRCQHALIGLFLIHTLPGELCKVVLPLVRHVFYQVIIILHRRF